MAAQRTLDRLFDIAIEHDGYFTIVEAKAAGIPSHRVAQLARRGSLERALRGVYHLGRYPMNADRMQLWEAILWPQQRDDDYQGVLSHQTALGIWEISDASPSRTHITIPPVKQFRRRPPLGVTVHFADLELEDICEQNGLPVTTVERTLRDCLATTERRIVLEGADDALRLGHFTAAEHERFLKSIEDG